MKKETLRKIISTVLSFAVAVLVALSVLLLCVSAVFSRPFAEFITTRERYTSAVREEVLLSLEAYAIPGGLPQDFFEDKITQEQISADVLRAADCAFSGTEFDCESLRQSLKNDIVLYAQENGIDTAEAEEDIDNLVTLCLSAYRNYTFSALLKYLGIGGKALFPWTLIAFAVFALLAAGLGVAVKKIGGTFYLRTGLSGGAAMLLLFPLYVLFSGSVSRLGLTSESMFFLATSLIYALLFALIFLALVILILANINYKKRAPLKS